MPAPPALRRRTVHRRRSAPRPEVLDHVDDRRRDLGFRGLRNRLARRPAVTIVTSLSGVSNPMPGREMSLTTTASSLLRSSLPRALATATSPCSAAKPIRTWPPGARPTARRARRWWARARAPCPSRPSFLILSSTARGGPEVGDGRGHQQHVGVGELRPAGVVELAPRSRRRRTRSRRRAAATTFAATTVTRRPAPRALGGQREAHPPRRAVADEAHGVDRLAGAARGDQHAQAVQRARREAVAAPARSIAARIAAGSASRPVPCSPREASDPLSGGTT